MEKIQIGILGATGSVGQKFIELLIDHPWFKIKDLAASERSAGKKYKEATNWLMPTLLPENIADEVVKKCSPAEVKSKVVFSGLDSSVAGEIEKEFAEAGHIVISNSKNYRMQADVPLIVPEVNPKHLGLLNAQKTKGRIVTNPNCSIIGLMVALKPLQDAFGIEAVNVVTMQAVSGAGYPGLSSMDVLDNVIPFIGGEEDKFFTEPHKILGSLEDNSIKDIELKVDVQCNRVPVIDGHMECVQVKFKNKPARDEIINAFNNFSGLPQELNLPSAPAKPLYYFEEDKYPQTKVHRNLENGMAVSVGRLREDNFFDYKFVVLSHNTIRGAAGDTILIAEMMKAQGYLDGIV